MHASDRPPEAGPAGLGCQSEITLVADTMPEIPLGVAFVDGKGQPGWIGRDATLQIHRPSVRGCWPRVISGHEE